jgi:hypothetical protein
VTHELDGGEFGIGDFRALGIFVFIPFGTQVPRREALGSTPMSRAGALVDRVQRFCDSYRDSNPALAGR